jgi:hypothetical protein
VSGEGDGCQQVPFSLHGKQEDCAMGRVRALTPDTLYHPVDVHLKE